MKAKGIAGLLSLVVFMAWGNAQEIVPVAVSPGSPSGGTAVGQGCPTFSWTAVDWAAGYKVVVFQATGSEVPAYEEMAGLFSPVLSKEIQGRASSWTPSAEERLSNGAQYIWYVEALDYSGQGRWSEGKSFQVVEDAVWDAGMEKRVRKTLKENGVSEDTAKKVVQDMRSEVTERAIREFDLQGGYRTQGQTEIQGYEGPSNTFYGLGAGLSITTGINSTFIGANAGRSTTTASNNTFLGYGAGYSNTIGYNNTFLGRHAGYSTTTANNNTFVGFYAGRLNTSGIYNTFLGSYAGTSNTTANYNTFLGSYSGFSNTEGYKNTFLGYSAGKSNTSGFQNTFIGYWAGISNKTAYNNTFIGYYAGKANTTGNGNTFVGLVAGDSNTTGYANSFFGGNAGDSNTTGYENTCVGGGAGLQNTTGSGNTYIGFNAGLNNAYGSGNTFVGRYTGLSSNGAANTFVGNNAGYTNKGNGNTFIGFNAGHDNTSGSGNVFLGEDAGYDEIGSNKLIIANEAQEVRFPLIYGEFDTAILTFNAKVGIQNWGPTHKLDVGYQGAYCDGGAWVDGSSWKVKENIQELTSKEALKAFEDLEPVKFYYKQDKKEQHLGFIAEDVPELVAMRDRKGLSSMDMVALLTKVVQEQQKTLEELKEKIRKLERRTQKKK